MMLQSQSFYCCSKLQRLRFGTGNQVSLRKNQSVPYEESFDGMQREHHVDFAHIILAASDMVTGQVIYKIGIPNRALPASHILKDIVQIPGQFSSKPMPIRQIFVQSQNSQARRDASQHRIERRKEMG